MIFSTCNRDKSSRTPKSTPSNTPQKTTPSKQATPKKAAIELSSDSEEEVPLSVLKARSPQKVQDCSLTAAAFPTGTVYLSVDVLNQ